MRDKDPRETREWTEAFASVVTFDSKERAQYLLECLLRQAEGHGIRLPRSLSTSYANSLPRFSGSERKCSPLLDKLTAVMRWNAIVMVMRAGKVDSSLGGHIASFASIATLFEVGFHYFFHAPTESHGGDLVYFQGHSSPGIYARAFLEGRLEEQDLERFRQEALAPGLSSYPHPWLMPNFWQFPTVSMGLGPLMAIYQAKFLKYLHNRSLLKTEGRMVWAFCGDGEMGEPESLGALNLAARECLDNLIFVVNCNLQRLDGPVWGNGQIIQEYERVFCGAGWRVIKVIWGENWEPLLEKDTEGLIVQRMQELVDGEYQVYASRDGAYLRKHFFGKDEALNALVADMTDSELAALQDGGHDPEQVYRAYQAAVAHQGAPVVVLVKTTKGYGMGEMGQAKNTTHQTKKMDLATLLKFRDSFALPLSDAEVEGLHYYRPAADSAEMRYLQAQRKALGGYLPQRRVDAKPLAIPPLSSFSAHLQGSGEREISTTMVFVRILATLLKEKALSERIVPIVADESRTFGMESLFRQIGIYAQAGQQYEPEDRDSFLYYKEDKKGQLLQEGISEAGAMSSWIAVATSYASNAMSMIPFFIYYSMFGFQRFGDLAWAAGDMRARGFILGATAGRTTLAGEGLQHQDGHNLLMFSMVPNCISYDPAFGYELAVIIQAGLERMYGLSEDVYYYITLMNENYCQPTMPEGVEADILKGLYLFRAFPEKCVKKVRLIGAGAILQEVLQAVSLLATFDVEAEVWSATSLNELRKEAEAVQRFNRLHPTAEPKQSHIARCLPGADIPVVAATDYIKLVSEQVRSEIKAPYYVLGTDGFGRSDTRKNLRAFFEVDAKNIAYTALYALFQQDMLSAEVLESAKKQLAIDSEVVSAIYR